MRNKKRHIPSKDPITGRGTGLCRKVRKERAVEKVKARRQERRQFKNFSDESRA